MAFLKLKFGGRRSPTRRHSGIGEVANNFGISKPKPSCADRKPASNDSDKPSRTTSNHGPLDLSTNTAATVDLSCTSRTSSVFVDVEYVKSALASSEDDGISEAQNYLDTPIHTRSRTSVLRQRRSRGRISKEHTNAGCKEHQHGKQYTGSEEEILAIIRRF